MKFNQNLNRELLLDFANSTEVSVDSVFNLNSLYEGF